MKKSEVLAILGDYVKSYYTEEISNHNWLVVESDSLPAYHMAMLSDKILSIQPTERKTIMVHFCSCIEID